MTYTGRGRRTQAERDAITIEIGYALFSAAFAAAVVFGAVAGPALLLTLPAIVERVLVLLGSALATALFFVRVASVLLRFRHAGGPVPRPGSRTAGPQPSQPGRTNPDS
ncbi:DUF6332 family protein [Streptomyces phyllanthi]|uniref:Uncharacterized protein n=1 Tax=Streptomyces phyllanthi TaxID=1803180 RepID=A0A5N8W9W1_9ACTN|nr:DUF6332 family protein [Streptomyces phyllanthi]MPY44280.1 hypothetical protein [Streptomyces phyllanthi]